MSKIKNLKLKIKNYAGFTMIELLIVIAVLGILAVAVLSAINPIEQINRGKDTGSRSDSEQLISAIDRFYTTKSYYPWMIDADSENKIVAFVEIATEDQLFGDDSQPMLTNLSSGGTAEVKAAFINRLVSATANKLSIYFSGTDGDSTYVCFVPKSSSFRDEAFKRCTAAGGLPDDFPAEGCPDASCKSAVESKDATACYSCLP